MKISSIHWVPFEKAREKKTKTLAQPDGPDGNMPLNRRKKKDKIPRPSF